jgi:hypothetical protein
MADIICARLLDHLPFSADLAMPSAVFGPVERSQGRQRWIATAWINLRSGVHPVRAYFESTLVGRLFALNVVVILLPSFYGPTVPILGLRLLE